jgi:hypothetical protein
MAVRRYSCELLFELVEECAYFDDAPQTIASAGEGVPSDPHGDPVGQSGKSGLIYGIVTEIHRGRRTRHKGQLPADRDSFVANFPGKDFPDFVSSLDTEAARR